MEGTSKQAYESIVAYRVSDMLLAIRIEDICRSKGKQFSRATTLDMLETNLLEGGLLVCDLTLVSRELDSLKKLSVRKMCKIFGYYPHVDKETERLAKSAGIDYVVPRSALQAKLLSLL